MNTKHTPGPWYPVNYAGLMHIQDGPFYTDKNILDDEYVGEEEVEANGLLAAAAPDLLDIVIHLLAEGAGSPELIDMAREALNKATGREANEK